MSEYWMELSSRGYNYKSPGSKDWRVQIYKGDESVHVYLVEGNYSEARKKAEEILRDHSTVIYAGGGKPSAPSRGSRRNRYLQDVRVAEAAINEPSWATSAGERAVQAIYRQRGWEIPDA